MRKLIYTILLILLAAHLYAQVANKTSGCPPLEIEFMAAAGSPTYFWDFGDGANSELQNPNHIFTMPGDFTVILYDQEGGTEAGRIDITVIPKAIAAFSGNPLTGCAPLGVQFTNESIIPSALSSDIEYVWTFGDGSPTSNAVNPPHTYTSGGNRTISLKLITTDENCGDTEIKNNYIQIPKVLPIPIFKPHITSICDPRDSIIFNVFDSEISGATYSWDFGDGTQAIGYGPIEHVFAMTGAFSPTLVISDAAGCSMTYEYPFKIFVVDGRPSLTQIFPDTLCVGALTILEIESEALSYLWSFPEDVGFDSRQLKTPEVYFDSVGNYTINLKAGPLACRLDTTFQVTVVQPNAGFAVSPPIFCGNPATLNFIADDQSLANYIWSPDTTQHAPSVNLIFQDTIADSFRLSKLTRLIHGLTVTDRHGCMNSDTAASFVHYPDAYFIPNVSRGCAPLEVEFSNMSDSDEPIIYYEWIFGDGDTTITTSNDAQFHTYAEPGEYYVKLIIENSTGCRDTSHSREIIVGEEIDLDFAIDVDASCSGTVVCMKALTEDERIDAWHFYTDNDRSAHCYLADSLCHQFSSGGEFEVTLVAEYNGCNSSLTKTEIIDLTGPGVGFTYELNCENPLEVKLNGVSSGANTTTWIIEGERIPATPGYVHTFKKSGDYVITLEAENLTLDCPISSISQVVLIRDVEARFSIEEKYCAGQFITIDASNSIDVYATPYQGYTFGLPGQRPRTVWYDSIGYRVKGRGLEPFYLVVRDINGCVDTLVQYAQIYNIEPEIEISDSLLCLGQPIDFTNLTQSDTTIISYDWSFGSSDSDPKQVEFTIDDVNLSDSTVNIILTMMDAVGCTATLDTQLKTYFPYTLISLEFDTFLCVDETITLRATDGQGETSAFNFNWQASNGTSSSDSFFTTSFSTAGDYEINLVATEIISGCQVNYSTTAHVDAIPTVSFNLPEELRCIDQILFENTSDMTQDVIYTWLPGDGSSPIPVINLFHGYDIGTYDVSLIATSPNGCADTVTQLLEIIEPSGDFILSDDVICMGDEITVEMIDATNVVSFSWDFGDGITLDSVNPATHEYNQIGTPRSTQIVLTIKAESGCETSIVKPIQIDGVLANFSFVLDSIICGAEFTDLSESSSGQQLNYMWEFGDGNVATDQNPTHVYGRADSFFVRQIIQATENIGLCIDTTGQWIVFPALDTLVGMPNAFTPNNDAINDFFNFVLLNQDQLLETVEVQEFKIFNRWGKLVYDNYDETEGWDGRIDGKDAPAEVYAYIIRLGFKGGASYSNKGNVTLLRGVR